MTRGRSRRRRGVVAPRPQGQMNWEGKSKVDETDQGDSDSGDSGNELEHVDRHSSPSKGRRRGADTRTGGYLHERVSSSRTDDVCMLSSLYCFIIKTRSAWMGSRIGKRDITKTFFTSDCRSTAESPLSSFHSQTLISSSKSH